MKLNPKFLTHVTKGEHYMISTSDTKFKGIVKNNETAAFIVECLKTDTTKEQIVEAMYEKYDAPKDVLQKDVESIVEKLRGIGAIEE